MVNFKKIEKKWQDKWEKKKVFEPEMNKKEPFYIQVAYPYPSGAMHIGHARTYTVGDVVAKYNMLKGKNVLMPMGWHVSGTPVIATVEALKRKDKKTIKKFTDNFRIPKKDLKKLESAKGFVKYMIDRAEYGYKKGFGILGLGIDWRRELTTIDKQYNKFIEWQYRKLNDKGYLIKGDYPIRYCVFDENAVGDHDLLEGEGVGIQEMVFLKFKLGDDYLIAATLRPETVYGQTNLWVNPDAEYVRIRVENENWIVSKESSKKLMRQKDVKVVSKILGKDLIGKHCVAPGVEKEMIILPAEFCDPNFGSGIVTSVPSDAPYDYIALKELDKEKCAKYGLNYNEIKKIKLIPIIKSKGFGDFPAKEICKEMNIENLNDSKLEEATNKVYKAGFHTGVMLKGKYKGMEIEKAKEKVKKDLIKEGKADIFYELEGKVVCRCGNECVVSILKDQWFLKYGDEKWKKESKKMLSKMDIVPDSFRKQYENVFDWLENKPCTREKGLGTKFPFDESKIVEPLGDSTIYMAYFTIAHIIKDIKEDQLTDEVFDYIFLGKKNVKCKISKKKLDEMRKNFEYWYPLAYNISALELIPNHMSFSIFQHTGIFPSNKRQKGTLNLGMLILDREKMSSSKGNVVLINDICEELGVDVVRFFLMNFVEPWEELDWRTEEVGKGLRSINNLIEKMFDFGDRKNGWLENAFNMRMEKYFDFMDRSELRKALQEISFGLLQDLKWFERKSEGKVSKNIVENWCKLIAPFMPFVAEELWEKIGNKKSIFESEFLKKVKVDEKVLEKEDKIRNLLDDVNNIKKIVGVFKKVYLYVIPNELRDYEVLKEFLEKEFGDVEIYALNDKEKYDPQNKAKKSKKGKPAIYLE